MEPSEPDGKPPLPALRGKRMRTTALGLTILVLIVTSFFSLRTPTTRSNLDAAQMQVDALFRTRALYSMRTLPGQAESPDYRRRTYALIRNLERIAELSATPRAIRRLALSQYAFGDPAWRSGLLRLRSVPGTGPSFETERELSMWGQVLGGRVEPNDVTRFERRIGALGLGWYEHLALEALYRHAGQPERASRQIGLANSSTSRLLTAVNLAALAGLAGLVFGIRHAVVAFGARTHNRRLTSSYVVSGPNRGRTPLTRQQADVLYTTFVIYLATFAIIRLVLGQVLGASISGLLSKYPPGLGLGVQLGVTLGSMIPAVSWLIIRGRAAGLTAASIGLVNTNLPKDIVWGISGYTVALPLVYLSSIMSGWLFRGVQSPPHPVIAELAATRGPLYLALLFVQVAILPPFTEELMFRGVFFRALGARMTIPAAVVLTSTLFAILHPQLPLGFLGIFVLGIIFNLLALYRGSLVPGMVAHALNNGVIFVFFMLLTAD